MTLILIIVFIAGYLAIISEYFIKVNKTAIALLTGAACWAISIISGNKDLALSELSYHLSSISEILFFLLAAMTIVELIDAHDGFSIITSLIKTRNKRKLLWIISIATFFLSAVLDNLTTAIIFITLLRKLMEDSRDRKIFACLIIIAANAGGAWSPIGDVTTTMLWIGGKITAFNIVKELFFPSLICLMCSTVYFSLKMKGSFQALIVTENNHRYISGRNIIFFLGLFMFLLVPVLKALFYLPPYIGMLIALSVVWIVSEIIHSDKDEEERKPYTAAYALSRIDSSSILFFLGILIAVSALESSQILHLLTEKLNSSIGDIDIIIFLTGLISALIDNVPIVAAAMGMYKISVFPVDSKIWEFLAYCAGTGGSILIIGSAAGVAVMGMEKISFSWYFKKISFIAFISYLTGALFYLLVY